MEQTAKENIQREIALMLKISNQYNLKDVNNAKKLCDYLHNKQLFKTKAGEVFTRRIESLANGQGEELPCIFCGKELADNGIICKQCLAKVQKSAIQKDSLSKQETVREVSEKSSVVEQKGVAKTVKKKRRLSKKGKIAIGVMATIMICAGVGYKTENEENEIEMSSIGKAEVETYNFAKSKVTPEEFLNGYLKCWEDIESESVLTIDYPQNDDYVIRSNGNYCKEYFVLLNNNDRGNILVEYDDNNAIDNVIFITYSYEDSELFYNMIHTLNPQLSPQETYDLLVDIMTKADENYGMGVEAMTSSYDNLYYFVAEGDNDFFQLEDGLVMFIDSELEDSSSKLTEASEKEIQGSDEGGNSASQQNKGETTAPAFEGDTKKFFGMEFEEALELAGAGAITNSSQYIVNDSIDLEIYLTNSIDDMTTYRVNRVYFDSEDAELSFLGICVGDTLKEADKILMNQETTYKGELTWVVSTDEEEYTVKLTTSNNINVDSIEVNSIVYSEYYPKEKTELNNPFAYEQDMHELEPIYWE